MHLYAGWSETMEETGDYHAIILQSSIYGLLYRLRPGLNHSTIFHNFITIFFWVDGNINYQESVYLQPRLVGLTYAIEDGGRKCLLALSVLYYFSSSVFLILIWFWM